MNIMHEEFIEKFKDWKNSNEYDIIGEYIGSAKHLEFKHKKCNKNFLMRPNNFQQGTRCPHFFFGNKEEHRKTLKET